MLELPAPVKNIAYTSFVEVLRARAKNEPNNRAFGFLTNGEKLDHTLTYAELDKRARQIAAYLQGAGATGERVLLLYPPGLEFAAAFMGCLYAGAVAVPASPPRSARTLPRLLAILKDAEPKVVLCDETILSMIRSTDSDDLLTQMNWQITDQLPGDMADTWKIPDVTANSLAFLQYTSGSTGSPKGVMVSHGNLLYNSGMLYEGFRGYLPDSVSVSWLPVYHDMGLIAHILYPLYAGFPSVLMSPMAFLKKPVRWLKAVSEYRATFSGAPNFAYELCVRKTTPEMREALDLSSWRSAYNGAEPIRRSTYERFAEAFAPYGFDPQARFPVYGLAEATLFVTGGTQPFDMVTETVSRSKLSENIVDTAPEDPADSVTLVGVGHTWREQEIAIVDPDTLQAVPDGGVGEIWLHGENVAQGYWKKPELTTKIFRAQLNDRPYMRTGDLGFMCNGEVFITGRAKDLIIIRGRNHYPEDIEQTVETAHEILRPGSGAVFALQEDGTERIIVVYEVERGNSDADFAQIATAIRQIVFENHELPIHTVVFIKPGSILKTSSGKIQRQGTKKLFLADGLKEIARDDLSDVRARMQENYIAPQTEMQQQIVGIWEEVLGIDTLGIQDNFFEIGGNSLTATQVASRIKETLHRDIPLRAMFEYPTPALLADIVETAPEIADIVLDEPADSYLLTYSQERMWLIYKMNPTSDAYNIASHFEITGELDVAALEKSLNTIMQRHEVLRSAFVLRDGKPAQIPVDDAPLPFEVDDLSYLPEGERDTEVARRIDKEVHTPFNIETEPVFRCKLFRLSADRHVISVVLHHIAADAWTFRVLWQELVAIYEAYEAGEAPDIAPLDLQIRTFAAWQRNTLDSNELDNQIAYWKQQLDGAATILDLPTDYPRPPVQTFNGKTIHIPIDSQMQQVSRIAHEMNATPYAIYMAAFYVLLNIYTRQDDILIASPVANRKTISSELLIGSFVNTLVMRGQIKPEMTFRDLIAQVQKTAIEAQNNQDLPFEQLVEIIQPERTPSHSPLTQVMLTLANVPFTEDELRLGRTVWNRMDEIDVGAQFDMSINMVDAAGIQSAAIVYNSDLFADAMVQKMVQQYAMLLDAILSDADVHIAAFSPFTEADKIGLAAWSNTVADYPREKTLPQLFEAQVEQTPDRAAVTFEGETLSYAELNKRANQLAHYLLAQGVQVEQPVGIHVARSLDMVVALLAVMKAGGCYVSLDPDFPAARLALIVEDANPALILTTSDIVDNISAGDVRKVLLDSDREHFAAQPVENPVVNLKPENLAYIIFTSGSTGRPKGVQIEHRTVMNFLNSMQKEPGLVPDDVLLAVTTLSFDIHVLELYLPLITGASVVIASREAQLDGSRLVQILENEHVTVMQATPATWRMMFDAGWTGKDDLTVLCGGEALPMDMAHRLIIGVKALWNMYGPTETTVWSTVHHVKAADGFIPIGHPIDNTTLYVLDEQMRQVPVGVPGELYIGGDGLARGYLHRDNLNAERFVPDPFRDTAGAKMYRTGDLVRVRVDGDLQFFGRMDFQVKVRGFRIELGDIETVLVEHPAVKQSVVIVREDTPGDKQLVGYIVTDTPDVESLSQIRRFVQDKLPQYMVPSFLVPMDSFPLTPNGKINRRALPAPDSSQMVATQNYVSPRNDVERKLAKMWQEVLNLPQVGIQDNFFDVGGHSLLAVKLFSMIEAQFNVNLPLATLFRAPTIAELAPHLQNHTFDQELWAPIVEIQTGGSKYPLFVVGGNLLLIKNLAGELGDDQPIYGLQTESMDNMEVLTATTADFARYFIRSIRAVQPVGPYYISGCYGSAAIAIEMAKQLREEGEDVAAVAAFGYLPNPYRSPFMVRVLRNLLMIPVVLLMMLRKEEPDEMLPYVADTRENTFWLHFSEYVKGRYWRVMFHWHRLIGRSLPSSLRGGVYEEMLVQRAAKAGASTLHYDDRVTVLLPPAMYHQQERAWGYADIVQENLLNVEEIPGDPCTMFISPNVEALADALEKHMPVIAK